MELGGLGVLKVPLNPKFRSYCSLLYVLVLVWLFGILSVEGESYTYYPTSANSGSIEYHRLNSLIRDYTKVLDRIKAGQHPGVSLNKEISGQVNLRAPRSELVGDMAHALRLYQLQELDRMYGSKSRPRFGKRNQAEFVEVIDNGGGGQDEQSDAVGGASRSMSGGGGEDDMISGASSSGMNEMR